MRATAVIHDHLSAALAVRRLFGVSALQAAGSLALLLSFGGAAVFLHHDTWLVLFGAMLLPMLVGAGGLLAVSRWLTLRWEALWIALTALLAICGAMAPWLYHFSLNSLKSPTLNDVQVTAVVVAFGLMALALPLWHAQSQARTLHLAKLRQAALIAELKALQAQVEPHFLFNTLANTRYLARHDADKAVQMLDHLIAYLHSALPDMRRAMSNVGRELKLAEHYLALMAIRFGARLSFQIDCASGLSNMALPPLMLMSLVENAVRHGVEPKPGQVRIWIAVKQDGADLQISVRDDGPGLNSGSLGNGVGLRNLRLRIEALYGRRASFILLTAADQTTEAKLQLPIVQQGMTSDA